MTVGPCTGAQSLAHWARRTPQATAIVEAGHRYSYAALAAMVVRTTKHLSGSGLPPGSIVAIACSSRAIHLVMILACECLGITTTSFVTPDLTEDNELLARCAVLYAEVPCPWRRTVPLTQDLVTAIMKIPVTANDFPLLEVQPNPNVGGRIVRTSGTTGQQKFMWNSPIVIDRIVAANRPTLAPPAVTEDFLCLYQFSYRPTYTHSLLAFRSGRSVVFSTIQGFERDLESIPNCHAVLLSADAAALCAKLAPPHRPEHRCGVHIDGGGVSAALRRSLLETFAAGVVISYSTNETNYISWVDEDGVGTIVPDASVRIVGEDGREVPMGETGRITVRTSRMVPGYLWNDALTERHFVDGWHLTGDLGFQPASRQLVVVGRADDMLNIGGIKVPPQPIETAIKALDGVIEAVLLGVDNDQGLVDLHLVVERSDPSADADLDRLIRPIVHRYGRDFVAHYRDSLPRTQTGKVQRAALKALIAPQAEGFAPV